MHDKNLKKINGNMAKITQKHVDSLFIMNTVTNSSDKNHETPVVSDENAEYARKFSEDNKK